MSALQIFVAVLAVLVIIVVLVSMFVGKGR